MTRPVQLTVLMLVLDKPGIYLWEIQYELSWMFGLSISLSSLLTRKKMQLVASQRDVSMYEDHFPIFIDETGCDRRNALRKYGYGVPVKCQNYL